MEEGSWKGPLLFFCDGAARGNPGPAAAAFIGFDAEGKLVGRRGEVLGETTNNVAEYRAVVGAMKFLERLERGGWARWGVKVFLDSELVVRQIRGEYKVKDRKLQKLAIEVKRQQEQLPFRISFFLVGREVNFWADRMVNEKLDEGRSRV